jgi:hypothetical protein
MAGRPGRSCGHNKIPLEQHILRGTFNPSRHGWRPSALASAVVPRTAPVSPEVAAGVVGRGAKFVGECWSTYDGWSPASLALLHEAGRLLDQLETVRGLPAERSAQRLLLATLAALRLEP